MNGNPSPPIDNRLAAPSPSALRSASTGSPFDALVEAATSQQPALPSISAILPAPAPTTQQQQQYGGHHAQSPSWPGAFALASPMYGGGNAPSPRTLLPPPTAQSPHYSNGSPYPSPIASTSSQQLPEPSINGQTKRRKSRGSGAAAMADSSYEGGSPPDDEGGLKKKPKIARACDGCRRRKIRCNVIENENPNEAPMCQHCKTHNENCTWETRFFKEKKGRGESARAQPAPRPPPRQPDPPPVQQHIPPPAQPVARPQQQPAPLHAPRPVLPQPAAATPTLQLPPLPPPMPHHLSPQPLTGTTSPMYNARMLGSTSMTSLVRTHGTFPTSNMDAFMSRHKQAFNATHDGSGFMRIIPPTEDVVQSASVVIPLPSQAYEQLVTQFFVQRSPLFPILSRRTLMGSGDINSLLLHVICGVSALDHRTPVGALRTLKANITELMRDEELTGRSTVEACIALLFFGLCVELERGRPGGSKSWNLAGMAIRMAQDLGLHREIGSEQTIDKSFELEDRRRAWAGLIVADRWLAAMYGLPMMIRLKDCDSQFPSDLPDPDMAPLSMLAFRHQLSLSLILGKVLRFYTPTGTYGMTDASAEELVEEMEQWQRNLPPELSFDDPTHRTLESGYLRTLSVSVWFLLFRPFLKISYSNERLTFALPLKYWSRMSDYAASAIEFIALPEHTWLLESWGPMLYSFFICSLLCYHTFVRQRDQEMLRRLFLARDTLKRIGSDDCVSRSKVTEVVCLLCHTAQQVQQWTPEREAASNGLNRQTPVEDNERGNNPPDQPQQQTPGEYAEQAGYEVNLADLWGSGEGLMFDVSAAPEDLMDFNGWQNFFSNAPIDGSINL